VTELLLALRATSVGDPATACDESLVKRQGRLALAYEDAPRLDVKRGGIGAMDARPSASGPVAPTRTVGAVGIFAVQDRMARNLLILRRFSDD
jgi:hypothetical protein